MNRRRDLQGVPLNLAAELAKAHVTDHAVVRYMERIEGRDLTALRAALLSAEVLQGMAIGAKTVVIPALRLRVCLSGHTVMTVTTLAMRTEAS